MVGKTLESVMENALISQLTKDMGQWTYRKDITTEDALWTNLRGHLNRLNIDKLDGQELSDSEMEQVKSFIADIGASTYKAAQWLSGEHGLAQIKVVRDDASLGSVHLIAVNNREFSGGNTCYEVINQYQAKAKDNNKDRRFDVTLLINGLPLIHIELKSRAKPYLDAFRQITKYATEGKFQSLMGLVQMFVVSNGEQTRYIAADIQGKNCFMNDKFLIRWVDDNNQPVEDYLRFAQEVLNIPIAHQMIGKYSVLDKDRKKLILLRPYQIHAIEAIRHATSEHQSGFIWHTTGSGKTLTSYTVTKNLLDVPCIDKTIFVIDRKDLDQQTSTAFLSYADNDCLDIRDTDNTFDLERKLKSNDKCAIITTIQKLQKLINRCMYGQSESEQCLAKIISNKRVAFIVDECHRAVSPETKLLLENFFISSLWYGFTGTPIFAENARAAKGSLPRTTAELFGSLDGKALHSYTIKDAIGDKSVLGFSINGLGFKHESLVELAWKLGLDGIEGMSDAELEKKVSSAYAQQTNNSLYLDDRHRLDVIDYIVNHCTKKLKLDALDGESYVGLLTVSKIDEAQRYYQLFKQFIADGKVDEKVRMLKPDFPKFAITYSVGENEDGALANQQLMSESLNDYNAMFGTSWSLRSLAGYNSDLNERLARKKSRYKNRDEQLDLVIVVDRLLTGFDSPCLSTIFLDRPPMKPQALIQAFSRTNRIFDKDKTCGHVVTFQSPELYAQKIEEALSLYSQGSTADVQAPSFAESAQKLTEAVAKFKSIVKTPADMKEIHQHGDLDDLIEVAKAYKKLDKAISSIQYYDEFEEESLESQFGISRKEFESFTGIYKNIIESIKDYDQGDDDEIVVIDFDYELEAITKIEVNYKYLVSLIQSMIPEDAPNERMLVRTIKEDQKVNDYIAKFSKTNKSVGEIISALWYELVFDPNKFRGQSAAQLISSRASDIANEKIRAFSKDWGFNEDFLNFFVQNAALQDSEQVVTPQIDDKCFHNYKSNGGNLSMLKYKIAAKNALPKLVEELRPLYRV